MKRFLRTWPGSLLLATSAWTLVGCIFAFPGLTAGMGRMALLSSLAQWWSWGLVAPLILAFDRRLPLTRKQLPLRLLAHLVPSFLFTAGYIYVYAAVRAALRIGHWGMLLNLQILLNALKSMFLWSWLVYWLITGAWQIYLYYEEYLSSELRLERLERNFSEARLNALRMQLDPHFLFNALNTISSHVERDPRLTRKMIEHLGDLLRMSLESKDKQQVPLTEELNFLDHYLAIQKIRFGDQLKIEIQVDADVRYALLPSLFLQPLVENAIRHGVSRRGSGGTVTVTARRSEDKLEIRVTDDGVGLPAGWTLENSTGLGLTVTRERIAGLYSNGQSRFAVRRLAAGGTEVAIALPFHGTKIPVASIAEEQEERPDARLRATLP